MIKERYEHGCWNSYKYSFTSEEKERILRRRKESQEIKKEIVEQYIAYFQSIPTIHRWTKKFGNKTIISYGLFAHKNDTNKKLFEKLSTLTDEELEKELTVLHENFTIKRPFRIKVCFDDTYRYHSVRFIFAEENELPVEPLGKKVDIVHWKDGDEEFHGGVLDDDLPF